MEADTSNGRNPTSRTHSRAKTGLGTALPVPMNSGDSKNLMRYYEAMSGALGPMHWWPARSPFEVIVGAILTQSTAWGNVERAIANLRSARMLTPPALQKARTSRLAALVRPSGYFRQKAKKLKAFVQFLQREYGGFLKRRRLKSGHIG